MPTFYNPKPRNAIVITINEHKKKTSLINIKLWRPPRNATIGIKRRIFMYFEPNNDGDETPGMEPEMPFPCGWTTTAADVNKI